MASGVDFPEGERTGTVVRQVLAASARAIESRVGKAAKVAAEALESLPPDDWREHYPAHIVRHTELLASSPDACITGARAGLDALYAAFHFNGQPLSVAVATAARGTAGMSSRFSTGVIRGLGNPTLGGEVFLPVASEPGVRVDKMLVGDEVISQLR